MFRLLRPVVSSSATLIVLCFAPVAGTQSHNSPHIEAIRYWSFGDVTRIVIQTEGDYKLTSDQIDNPSRLYFDLNGLRPPSPRHRGIDTIQVGDGLLKHIRIAEVSPGKTRVVCDLEGPVDVVSSELVNPDRLIIEIRPKAASVPALSAPNRPPVEGVAVVPANASSIAAPPQLSPTPRMHSPTPG